MYSPSKAMSTAEISNLRPIALVGMMGTGKTSIGRLLAARLHRPFHDSDEAVEQQAGMHLDRIFTDRGEAAFRELERQAIQHALTLGPIVLATGGGAFCDRETRQLLLARAVTIWLHASPETLAQRLQGDTQRPLLTNQEPLPALRRLLTEREPAYRQAHLKVETDGLGLEDSTEALLRAITRGSTHLPDRR
jgi:shikimate kinase